MSYYQIPLNSKILLEEIFGKAVESTSLTSNDYQAIKNAISDNSLTKEENAMIKRLFHGIRRGYLKLAD